MTTSPILEIIAINEAQSQKATAVNVALTQLEQVVAAKLVFDTTGLTTAAPIGTLPFDDSGDLTARTALRFVYLELTAGATDDFQIVHPDNAHLFYVRNNAAHEATVKTAAGTGIAVAAAGISILYCDGVNVIDLSSGVGGSGGSIQQASDYEVSFYGTPVTDQIVAKYLVSRNTVFAADFAGSVGSVDTNPTASFVLEVEDDAVQIGTITIATNGTFTFTTVANAVQNVAAGSIITVVAPTTVDATVANILTVLAGSVTVAQ